MTELIDHIEAVQIYTGASREEAIALIDAAEPLWDAMGELGWTDAYGGGESRRVVPETLAFVRHRSNCRGDCSFCVAFAAIAPAVADE